MESLKRELAYNGWVEYAPERYVHYGTRDWFRIPTNIESVKKSEITKNNCLLPEDILAMKTAGWEYSQGVFNRNGCVVRLEHGYNIEVFEIDPATCKSAFFTFATLPEAIAHVNNKRVEIAQAGGNKYMEQLTANLFPSPGNKYKCLFNITEFTFDYQKITAEANGYQSTNSYTQDAALWIQSEIAKNYAAYSYYHDDVQRRLVPQNYNSVKIDLAKVGYVLKESTRSYDLFVADVSGAADVIIWIKPAKKSYRVSLCGRNENCMFAYENEKDIAEWVMQKQPLYVKLLEARETAAKISARLEKINALVLEIK